MYFVLASDILHTFGIIFVWFARFAWARAHNTQPHTHTRRRWLAVSSVIATVAAFDMSWSVLIRLSCSRRRRRGHCLLLHTLFFSFCDLFGVVLLAHLISYTNSLNISFDVFYTRRSICISTVALCVGCVVCMFAPI